MKIKELHPFNVTYQAALAIQASLREKLTIEDDPGLRLRLIAGADVSYARNSDLFFAAVVLHTYPEMEIVETAYAALKSVFPYIPGLLTFREGPALIAAFAKLHRAPDLVIFDGQGIAHPRGLGLASHMGLLLNVPAVGCAKSRLFGIHGPVGEGAGDNVPLTDDGRVIGAVVRTKRRIKPVFVSPGQGIGLEKSVEVVLSCCRGYRLPEPVRNAHLAVNRYRQSQAAAAPTSSP